MASAEDGAARRAIIGSKRVRIRPLTGAPVRGIAGLGARAVGRVLGDKVGQTAAASADTLVVADAWRGKGKAPESSDAASGRGGPGTPKRALASETLGAGGIAARQGERLGPG